MPSRLRTAGIKVATAWKGLGRQNQLTTVISAGVVLVLAILLPLSLGAHSSTASPKHVATAKDYRAFSDDLVKLIAKGTGKDASNVDLDDFWAKNHKGMTASAKSTCSDLLTKSKAENISSADLVVALSEDGGTDEMTALVDEQATVQAAYDTVCPDADKHAPEVLAHLVVEEALLP